MAVVGSRVFWKATGSILEDTTELVQCGHS